MKKIILKIHPKNTSNNNKYIIIYLNIIKFYKIFKIGLRLGNRKL